MVILHAFGALASGFALVLILTFLFDAMLQRVAPSWAMGKGRSSLKAVLASLLWSLVAGSAGGCVTVWLSAVSPLSYALALAIVLLALGTLSVLQERERLPFTLTLLLVVVPPLGVMAGALLRLRVLGLL